MSQLANYLFEGDPSFLLSSEGVMPLRANTYREHLRHLSPRVARRCRTLFDEIPWPSAMRSELASIGSMAAIGTLERRLEGGARLMFPDEQPQFVATLLTRLALLRVNSEHFEYLTLPDSTLVALSNAGDLRRVLAVVSKTAPEAQQVETRIKELVQVCHEAGYRQFVLNDAQAAVAALWEIGPGGAPGSPDEALQALGVPAMAATALFPEIRLNESVRSPATPNVPPPPTASSPVPPPPPALARRHATRPPAMRDLQTTPPPPTAAGAQAPTPPAPTAAGAQAPTPPPSSGSGPTPALPPPPPDPRPEASVPPAPSISSQEGIAGVSTRRGDNSGTEEDRKKTRARPLPASSHANTATLAAAVREASRDSRISAPSAVDTEDSHVGADGASDLDAESDGLDAANEYR